MAQEQMQSKSRKPALQDKRSSVSLPKSRNTYIKGHPTENASCQTIAATYSVEKHIPEVPDIYKEKNIHQNISRVCDYFKQPGSARQAAKNQASVVKEREIKYQLQAKTAELRGKRALVEERRQSQYKLENMRNWMKSRKQALEAERKRSSSIISRHKPLNTCIDVRCTDKNRKRLPCKSAWTTYSVEKHVPETNAYENAEIVSSSIRLIEKEHEERKLALEEKHSVERKRYHAALKKDRAAKACSAALDMLKKAEIRYHRENAKQDSQIKKDRRTMRPPVDKLIKIDKQEKLEKPFKKVLPKEHKKTEVSLKRFGCSSLKSEKSFLDFDSLLQADSFKERYFLTREKSSDDISSTNLSPPVDILNMAYIETLPCDRPPPFTSSSIPSIKPVKRDFGVQVEDSMFPVSRGVQVDLLPRRDSLLISQNKSGKFSAIPPSKLDSSKYHTASSDFKKIVSENSKLHKRIERSLRKKRSKQKNKVSSESFCPISSPQLVDNQRVRKMLISLIQKKPHLFPGKFPVQSVPLSEPVQDRFVNTGSCIAGGSPKHPFPSKLPVQAIPLSEPIRDRFVNAGSCISRSTRKHPIPGKFPVQAVPLSEPVRDRFIQNEGSFILGGAPEVIEKENLVAGEPCSFVHISKSLNSIRKHLETQLKARNIKNDDVNSSSFPTHPLNIAETGSSFPVHPFSIVENSVDSFQSWPHVKKELDNISMLVNLSEAEISCTSELEDDKEKWPAVLSSTVPAETVPYLSNCLHQLLILLYRSSREEHDSTSFTMFAQLSEILHLIKSIKNLEQCLIIDNSFSSKIEKHQHEAVEKVVLKSHSSSKLTGRSEGKTISSLYLSPALPSKKATISVPSIDPFLEKYSKRLSHGSNIPSHTQNLTILSDSSSSNKHSPITMNPLTATPQVSPNPFDLKSKLKKKTSKEITSEKIHLPTSLKIRESPCSTEYHRTVNALIPNYALSPPTFHAPIANQNGDKLKIWTEKRCQISNVSQINQDLNQGNLTLLTSNSNKSSPTKSSHGSFKTLSLVLSTSNDSSDISKRPLGSKMPSISVSAQQSYDVIVKSKMTPTLSSQCLIPIPSPLSYIADTGSASPNSETLQPKSLCVPETTSSEVIAVESPIQISQEHLPLHLKLMEKDFLGMQKSSSRKYLPLMKMKKHCQSLNLSIRLIVSNMQDFSLVMHLN